MCLPVVPTCIASMLCTLCWLTGTVALEVVISERLRSDDYGSRDVLTAMQSWLTDHPMRSAVIGNGELSSFTSGSSLLMSKAGKAAIIKDLTLHDLSFMAKERGKSLSWRREEIFADETGSKWQPFGMYCIDALNAVTSDMAVVLTSSSSSATTAAVKQGDTSQQQQQQKEHRWNVLPSSLATQAVTGQRKTVDALCAVRCRYQRAKHAVHALCEFAVSSLKEDFYGVLQLGHPNVGDILLCMLSNLMATQQFMKHAVSSRGAAAILGPWRGTGDNPYGNMEPDAAVHALHDEVSTCLHAMSMVFGNALMDAFVNGNSTSEAVYGDRREAEKLLKSFLID